MTVYTRIFDDRVDLWIKREFPVRAWPSGELIEWERFSWPLRCKAKVLELAKYLPTIQGGADEVRKFRRAILWSK